MKIIRMKLKAYLDENKITRYALSKMTGIKYQTIDGYCKNNVSRYSNENVVKILDALKCNIEDILELADVPDEEKPAKEKNAEP